MVDATDALVEKLNSVFAADDKSGDAPAANSEEKDQEPLSLDPPSFQHTDKSFELGQSKQWMEHLDSQGWVRLSGIVSPDDVKTARSLFWDYLESDLPTSKVTPLEKLDLKRDDPKSWARWNPAMTGFLIAAGQSKGAWFVRSRPGVHHAFSKVWETSDLIISMDAVIAWKPWWVKEQIWEPRTEGLHLDQNPYQRKKRKNLNGRASVQGMVVLYDVTRETGGLEVVPKSHLAENQAALQKRYARWNRPMTGDWCVLDRSDKYYNRENRTLITAKAGDLILWDSRTVHGGLVGDGKAASDQPRTLARLSVPVCMAPMQWASKKALKERKKAFLLGGVLSHWPHEQVSSGGHFNRRKREGYEPVDLNDSKTFGKGFTKLLGFKLPKKKPSEDQKEETN